MDFHNPEDGSVRLGFQLQGDDLPQAMTVIHARALIHTDKTRRTAGRVTRRDSKQRRLSLTTLTTVRRSPIWRYYGGARRQKSAGTISHRESLCRTGSLRASMTASRYQAIRPISGRQPIVPQPGHLEEQGFGASIEANFIIGSQVRLHRVTNACPQAYFGMILARISGGIRVLNRIRLWAVVAHGKRGGGSCSLGWPW